jgi:hypothetical protein
MPFEHRLTLDASAAEYVIDVANVVREPALGGERAADLARLAGLLDALAEFTRDPAVQVYAITDRSLLTDGRLRPRSGRVWTAGITNGCWKGCRAPTTASWSWPTHWSCV